MKKNPLLDRTIWGITIRDYLFFISIIFVIALIFWLVKDNNPTHSLDFNVYG